MKKLLLIAAMFATTAKAQMTVAVFQDTVAQRITNKTGPKSITPANVGQTFVDLSDIVGAINYTAGTGINIAGGIITNTGTFAQALARDSVGTHRLGISNATAAIAAHFQGSNTSFRTALLTTSAGAGIQAYDNGLSSARNLHVNSAGGNVRIGSGTVTAYKFQVNGKVWINNDSISTGSLGTDNFLMNSGGEVKQITPATLSASITPPGNYERTYSNTSTVIDVKNSGATLLFTTNPSNGRFIITRINYWVVLNSGTSVGATYNLGWTASTYNDIISAGTIDKNVAANLQGAVITTNTITIPASTDVYFNVTTPATTAGFRIKYEVTGHYETP